MKKQFRIGGLVIAAIAALGSTAVPARAQGFRPQVQPSGAITGAVLNPQLRQAILARPKRLIAVPTSFDKIAKPILKIDNQPDVDLRPQLKTAGLYGVRSQGARGTCSVFALTFLIEYNVFTAKNAKNADYSEEFLNYASNKAIGINSDGGFFDALDAGLQAFGIPVEYRAPYQATFQPDLKYPVSTTDAAKLFTPKLKLTFVKPWDVTTGLSTSHLASIQILLKKGIPVAAGLRWPQQGFFKTQDVLGVTTMVDPGASNVFDGHSIVFVGFKKSDAWPGGGYLVFRNSWGSGWGDEGYGYMSFDYAKKYANDLAWYGPAA